MRYSVKGGVVKMEMKITYGKKVIELKSVKSGKWNIETRTSLVSLDDVFKKLHLVSWRIINKRRLKK